MLSHFELVKSELTLEKVIQHYVHSELVSCGSSTYQLEDKSCPFCKHYDCFKINQPEEDPEYYHCFSCKSAGDVITFAQSLHSLEKPYDAIKKLSEDFGITLPESSLSPAQQILDAAMEYYENLLWSDGNTYEYLGNLTPLQYQLTVRKHEEGPLKALRIGWSDGRVVEYLESVGFDPDVVKQSGIASSKFKGDFIPAGSFIYPHMVRGRTSTFTFKNLSKGLSFRMKKETWLNNTMFYNQDSVEEHDEVVIVEGENDLLSVMESGWEYAVIGTNGQLSKDQIHWLSKSLPGKRLITGFDADDAGDGYRDKLATLSIRDNVQVDHLKVPVQFGDIDKFLKEGHSFEDVMTKHSVHVMGGVEVKDGIVKFDNINVYEKDRCYHKVTIKDGEPSSNQISNFVIHLKHILLIGDKRFRVVQVHRMDGFKSGDVLIDSDTKVNLRIFKRRIAEFTDGFFYGSEKDLEEMWRHIFNKDGENLVDMPSEIGRLSMPGWGGYWLFKNVLVDRRGEFHFPDDHGVFWPKGKLSKGIRAQSITAESAIDKSLEGIPEMTILEKESDYDDAVKFFLENLIENFGNKAQAITTVGWCMANAFSDPIFNYYKFFPFMFIWGKFGGGKSGILKILLSIYGMNDHGATTVGSLKSGVGFERKMAYYSSLPLALDEVRSDKETRDNYSNFRKWFNRQGRAKGSMDSSDKIKQVDVRSTIIFGGEEIIEESATRSRIIPMRLARMEDPSREVNKTYERFMKAMDGKLMSAIGLHWVKMSCTSDIDGMFKEMQRLKGQLKEECVNVRTRTIDIYSIVGFFGSYLSEKYYPGYDYVKELAAIIEDDTEDQDTSDVVSKFFDVIDGLISSGSQDITSHHIFVREGVLHVWFQDLYRIANRTLKELSDGNTISANAIRKALKEETYYLRDDKVDVGMGNNYRRRCILLDVSKLPANINNVANASELLPT